jgi:hypothetical protein
MKNIVFCVLLLPFYVQAQAILIDSFLGINFGLSKSEAVKTAESFGAVVHNLDGREGLLVLSNVKVCGLNSSATYLKFANDSFFEGIAEFHVDKDNFVSTFNKLKIQLVGPYGYGKDFSWFEPPFYFGDGNEFEAILSRRGKLCHAWGNPKQITSDNFIILEVCSDKKIRLVFQHHKIAKLLNASSGQLSAKN